MTSVCYLIVCVNLLYSFDRAEPYTPPKSWYKANDEQQTLVKSLNVENQFEYLAKSVTPYWNMSYNQQLEHKQNQCRADVEMIGTRSHNLKNLMTYKILPIVPSPVTEAYRNKDEFQISFGVDGNSKTVGCTIGKLSFGRTFAVRPTKVVTIKESHKKVAQVYEDYIRLSPIAASNNPYDSGHWNTLIVRSNEAGDVMACVTVKPTGYSVRTVEAQKQALKSFFYNRLPNITLFHQQCPKKRCNSREAPFVQLYGKAFLMETLNDYMFRIYPDTIFPSNKLAEELFYDAIIKTAKLNASTTVLDVCSGTGLNSIMVSKFVKEVLGFESVAKGVIEGNSLVQFNNIHNVKFYLGRINNNLNVIMQNINESSDVVAILNHRRLGIGVDVVRTIRSCVQVSRVVYMFYQSNSPYAVQTFVDLCSDGNSNGHPFRLTKVIPVDLLPQTAYIEVVLLFERAPVGNI